MSSYSRHWPYVDSGTGSRASSLSNLASSTNGRYGDMASSSGRPYSSAYDSGMRSYSSARALNDSSGSYGSRYGSSSYEPTAGRYSSAGSAATGTRYGGSASAVDRYSSPVRSVSPVKNLGSSYSSLRYGSGSGDAAGNSASLSTNYRPPTRDYGPSYPPRSYSYSSGLAGSNASNGYSSTGNIMSRSSYAPGSYRSGDYGTGSGSRMSSYRRSEDYGGPSGRLYTSLTDAHSNIVGRRQSLPRGGDAITISSTPSTPTAEPVAAPSWRERSLGATPITTDNTSKPYTDTLKVDTSGFSLAKPSLPSPIAEGSPTAADNEDKVTKDYLDAEVEFNRFYDRYVTHSPILELERESGGGGGTNEDDTASNNENAERADDSAYSSRMEESGTTIKDSTGSETMSQSRTSDNGQEQEEIEYEAEEVGTEVEEQATEKQDENSETEKEEGNIPTEDETKKEQTPDDDDDDDENANEIDTAEKNISSKTCLDVEPPWAQFTSSFEEDEEEAENADEADDEADGAREVGKSTHGDKEFSAEPADQAAAMMTSSMYDYKSSEQGENEEEEEEEDYPAPVQRKPRRMMMTFADAIKRRCEEVTGVSVEEEEPDDSGLQQWREPVVPTDAWQQFSFYDDDDAGADEAEGEEEASMQVPPWQQFIDYSIPSKSNKYHLQVKAVNESESEYTSDEEGIAHIRNRGGGGITATADGGDHHKSRKYAHLLAPPKDSGAETSSELESDYEANDSEKKKRHFRFLPPEEEEEERGRVEEHLAQPAPVFSIKVTYDSAEEESVGTVSDFEDINDDEDDASHDDEKEATHEPEEKDGSVTPTRGRTPALEVPQIMVTSMDEPEMCTIIPTKSRRVRSESPAARVGKEERYSVAKTKDDSAASSNYIELTVRRTPMEKDEEQSRAEAPETMTVAREKSTEKMNLEHEKSDHDEPPPPSAVEAENPKEPEIILDLKQAKQMTENVPAGRTDRYVFRKDPENKAVLRIHRGVSDVARQAPQVQPKIAAKLEKPEPRQISEPPVEVKASSPQRGKQERVEVPGETTDPHIAKKAQGTWAKKLVVPDAKLSTANATSQPSPEVGLAAKAEGVAREQNKKEPASSLERKSAEPAEMKTNKTEPATRKTSAEQLKTTGAATDKGNQKPNAAKAVTTEPEPKKAPASIYEQKLKAAEEQQNKAVEATRKSSLSNRRGSGIVGAMASKFKAEDTPPPLAQVAPQTKTETSAEKGKVTDLSIQKEPIGLGASQKSQRLLSPQAAPKASDSSSRPAADPNKRNSSQPPAEKQSAAPPGPSFEEQMEELRKKIKSGSSQLSQQVKDMSKGINDAKLNAKLAAEMANAKGLLDDAANLRGMVSRKYDQWKTTSQQEMEKRQKQLEEPIDRKKGRSVSPAASIHQESYPKAATEIDGGYVQKAKPKDEPPPTQVPAPAAAKKTSREPGKIMSPFAEKARKEAELVKAAMEERARRDNAKQEQQRRQQEQQKQEEQRQKHQQQQKLQSAAAQHQQLEQLLSQKTPANKHQQQQQQMASATDKGRSQFPPSRRPEPEGESDQDATSTIRRRYGPRYGQQPPSAMAENKEGKQPLPGFGQHKSTAQTPPQEAASVAAAKIKEAAKKETTELSKSKINTADLVEQGTAGKAQIMGQDQQMRAELSSTRGKLHQAGEATLAGGQQKKILGEKLEKTKTSGTKAMKWRRRRPSRFIGAVQDVDELLNGGIGGRQQQRLSTFDQFELFYQNCSRDKRSEINKKPAPKKSLESSKVFIGDMKNVDDLYKPADLRTLMGMFSPTSKVAFNFDDAAAKAKLVEKLRKPGDGTKKIDESTLQIYRSYEGGRGDYGTYLDSDLSLTEQPDELAVLRDGKRTSLVLRTQLSVRVHLIIEKLLNSSGRELRRALFSLKQIFQDDKDLVHEFVQNDGLSCLIKVGAEADQNYQNYILRAIGQVMLYVDGMNGCIAHNETIQWLYSLLSSPFRLVVKSALKLLLVFVEYTESNSLLLLAAVYIVDKNRGGIPWSNLVQLLTNKDSCGGDLELLIYAMTLLNTTLGGIPDQDTYYDIVDALEEQGIEDAIKRLTGLGNQELTDQCRLYEAVLREEDGAPDENGCSAALNSPAMNIAKMRQTPRTRVGSGDRKSQRKRSDRSTPEDNRLSTSPRHHPQQNGSSSAGRNNNWLDPSGQQQPQKTSQRVRAPPALQKVDGLPQSAGRKSSIETPGLSANKRLTMDLLYKKSGSGANSNNYEDDADDKPAAPEQQLRKKTSLSSLVQQQQDQSESFDQDINANLQKTRCPPPALPDFTKLAESMGGMATTGESPASPPPGNAQRMMGGRSSIGAVHSLAEKFHQPADSPQQQQSPSNQQQQQDEDEPQAGSNPFASALARARKGMDKKVAAREAVDGRKESEIQWELAMQNWRERPLIINNLDFTELDDADDQDPVRMSMTAGGGGGRSPAPMVNPYTGVAYTPSSSAAAPPPPPSFGGMPPPPPPGGSLGAPPPPRLTPSPTPTMGRASSPSQQQQKDTKTVKLFWKEAQVEPLPGVLDKKGGVFWQKVKPVDIDVEKLNQLFETKTIDRTVAKKKDVKSELRVLDNKRSQAINIGLKKLPPPGAIRTAITKFDSSILNKEGIEKILTTMMPTEEEKEKIAEAVAVNPDVNLGEAEKFLLMLGEIPQLHARLRLWMFMLDYSSIEKDVADPLMDLKLAMEELDQSKSFQYVMATLLAVGNYLNGADVKGFQLDYLAKVPEVKDTVHKYSLVYHLCTIVMEKFPDSTDLYSELGAVVRCARFDFDEIDLNLQRLEKDCKSSWDYLRLIAKHESQALKQKMSEFLTECAQRIIVLKTIYRRVINRFRRFLLYMGMPQHSVKDTKVNSVCKTIAEFALEYRTCRDKQLQQKKRLLEKRERNKTRGKMIVDTRQLYQQENGGGGATSSAVARDDDGRKQHDELSRVLRTAGRRADDEPNPWTGSFPGARLRSTRQSATSSPSSTLDRSSVVGGGQESPDDEILDGLVKAATVKTDPSRVEQRRKARQFNRKSLRRTRTLKLVEDQVGGED